MNAGVQRTASGDERRSSSYRWAGHLLAWLACVLFTLVFGVAVYKRSAWQRVNFREAVVVDEAHCQVYTASSSDAAFPQDLAGPVAVRVPHAAEALRPHFADAAARWFHVAYLCQLPRAAKASGQGLSYLHTGWVFGEKAEVLINGVVRVSWQGRDKAIVALAPEEMALSALAFEIRASGRSGDMLGLVGLQPLALATGSSANSLILGIETELSTVGNLLFLLPSAILGLFLAFGWGYGVRLRLMLVGLAYFASCTVRAMITQFLDLWPWSLEVSYVLQAAATILVSGSFLAFGMELLGLAKRWIYPLLRASCLLAMVLAGVLVGCVEKPVTYLSPVVMTNRLVLVTALLALIAASLWRFAAGSSRREDRRVRMAFLGMAGLLAGSTAADAILIVTGSAIRLAPSIDVLMPSVAGAVLFFALAIIEKRWMAERTEREILQNALALGASAQRLLLPQHMAGRFGRFRHESFYRPAGTMSGDWLCHWQTDDGELRLLLGDVVGKGPQAALGTTAIAAVMADCRLAGETVERCIERVNEALLATFGGFITTTLMAVVLRKNGATTLYNCGGIGWFIRDGSSGEVAQHRVPGSILGMEASARIGCVTVELAPLSMLTSFSDGVCDGARGVRKLLQSLHEMNADISFADVFARAVAAGARTTLLDDQTMVVIAAD